MRTLPARFKSIYRLLATVAFPHGSTKGRLATLRTGEALATRQPRYPSENRRLLQTTPTIHQHKGRHEANQNTAQEDGQRHQAHRAQNADGRGDGKAPGTPKDKPE